MRGHAVTMSLVIVSIVLYMFMFLYLRRANSKRERGDRDAVMSGLTEEEIIGLGDENPRYRFAT